MRVAARIGLERNDEVLQFSDDSGEDALFKGMQFKFDEEWREDYEEYVWSHDIGKYQIVIITTKDASAVEVDAVRKCDNYASSIHTTAIRGAILNAKEAKKHKIDCNGGYCIVLAKLSKAIDGAKAACIKANAIYDAMPDKIKINDAVFNSIRQDDSENFIEGEFEAELGIYDVYIKVLLDHVGNIMSYSAMLSTYVNHVNCVADLDGVPLSTSVEGIVLSLLEKFKIKHKADLLRFTKVADRKISQFKYQFDDGVNVKKRSLDIDATNDDFITDLNKLLRKYQLKVKK